MSGERTARDRIDGQVLTHLLDVERLSAVSHLVQVLEVGLQGLSHHDEQLLHFATGKGGAGHRPDLLPGLVSGEQKHLIDDRVISVESHPIVEAVEVLHQYLFDEFGFGAMQDRCAPVIDAANCTSSTSHITIIITHRSFRIV